MNLYDIMTKRKHVGAWFNGRASVSKTVDAGSIPAAPAIFLYISILLICVNTVDTNSST